MGKSANEIRSFEVSMWSERYADERPLGLRKYQLPPTSSEASKHVCSMPLSRSALHETSPLTPAPMTATCMPGTLTGRGRERRHPGEAVWLGARRPRHHRGLCVH